MEIIDQLLKAIEINDEVVICSTSIDDTTKCAFLKLSAYIKDFLIVNSQKRKLKSHEINSLKNELLIYWNESVNNDVEQFWIKLKQQSIPFERKDPLRRALINNRFKRVEQGMGARNFWPVLKEMNSITQRFTESEIVRLHQIISEDEKYRLSILNKVLAHKKIFSSQYLKFGECMAYFENCKLFMVYFNENEKNELFQIWLNYNTGESKAIKS
ncbi:hypothetical protein [Mucilaginibacter sp.]|uniref:hypothetical protein n=1 Tax=Mucilaginibacter sp. TaxID=1882438 RepID=UPI0025EEAFBD|nr:hypothetical protein [Mucilaginibacter sp.]